MNKLIICAFVFLTASACNDNVKTEKEETEQRDSFDADQRIKDSLDVEAKILQDMESEENKTETYKEGK